MNQVNKYIGLRLEEFRSTTTYSQEHVAQMLGLSRGQYCNLLKGKSNWYAKYILVLCRLFNCQPNELFPLIKRVNPNVKIKKKILVKDFKVFDKIKL